MREPVDAIEMPAVSDQLPSGRTVALGVERAQPVGHPSPRVGRVGLEFGLSLQTRRVTIVGDRSVVVGPGRVILLTGPSGSGKTSALNRIAEQFVTACNVHGAAFPPGVALIDRVAPWAPLSDAIALLTACGLGDANLWVRPFTTLSDGERFRARLARAVALNERDRGVAPLLCDEFCATLHRRCAKAISFNLRKLVRRRGLSVVVASSNDDLAPDLNPNVTVRFSGLGRCVVEERVVQRRGAVSFRRGLTIEPGSKRDYDAFAAMHYRATDELGFVDKVFVLREGRGGEALGIVVYSHGPLELSLRNQATGGRFVRNARAVNRRFRILRRLVVHPDARGCGLGHYLVRMTLPLVGTDYVECLAAMGEHNPVFEKAGMTRVGQYDIAPRRKAALESLRAMDVDPSSPDFTSHVCRRRSVRKIVAQQVYDWYATTTAGGESRVERQSPEFLAQTFRGLIASRPVYYLWRRKRRRATTQRKRKA